MPSIEHQTVVELIRTAPETAIRLLSRVLESKLPAYKTFRVTNASIDHVVPIEFRADVIIELFDEQGALLGEIIFEVQTSIDNDKPYVWPVYLCTRRAKRRGKVILVIVTWDEDVAAWASRPIDLEFGQGVLRLPVIGPRFIPRITDEEQACSDPSLAVLSALAHAREPHGGHEIGLSAFVGLLKRANKQIDTELTQAYLLTVWSALSPLTRRMVEAIVMQISGQHDITQIPFIKRLLDQAVERAVEQAVAKAVEQAVEQAVAKAKAEAEAIGEARETRGEAHGEARGEAHGRALGEAQGMLKALRTILFDFVKQKNLILTQEQQQRIVTCEDPALLQRWTHNSLLAKSADELFAEGPSNGHSMIPL